MRKRWLVVMTVLEMACVATAHAAVRWSTSDDMELSLNGIVGVSAYITSCTEATPFLRTRCSSDDLDFSRYNYGIADGIFPSQVSLQLSKKFSDVLIGSAAAVRLPWTRDFNIKEALPSSTDRDIITKSIIFWGSDASGWFDAGRNVPFIGRWLSSYTPLLNKPSNSLKRSGGYASASWRSYEMLSYTTPWAKSFSAQFAWGDSQRLLEKSGLAEKVHSIYPNVSWSVSYKKDNVIQTWFSYFFQRLGFLSKAPLPNSDISAKEWGAVIGNSTGDGLSLILDYQSGRALSLLSDDGVSTALVLPDRQNILWGIAYRRVANRMALNYSKILIFDRSIRRFDRWTLSASHQINHSFLVLGQLAISRELYGTGAHEPIAAWEMGFVLTF